MKKEELIKVLVEEYGYEKEDLKFDAEGNRYTNARLQRLIQAEIDDEAELNKNKNRVVSKQGKTLKDEDKIRVMSGMMGTVIYRSDITNRVWKFETFGQEDNIPYGELVAIRNRYPRYLLEGWFVVLDEEVQDEFNLVDLYKNILTPDNIDSVFKKPIKELSYFIDHLPDGMKNTFINKAQEMYQSRELDSVRVIDLIEEKFGFSLVDNAPLNDYALKTEVGSDNIIYIDKK